MHQQSFSLRELLLGTFFVLVGLVGVFAALYPLLTVALSKIWPITRGEVILMNIHKDKMPSSECPSGCYMPMITYRYTVSGTEYTCDEILTITSSEAEINKIQNKFAIGSYVDVHYHRENPQSCVTGYYKVSMVSLVAFLFGLLFIAMGSLFAWDNMVTIARKLIHNIDRLKSHL